MPSRIEDYALVGDCQTAALVSRDGSIDWLCWPRFDSGACFSALLGTPEHGCWKLAPAGAVQSTSRRYRKGTLILDTDFETEHGTVSVTDFMPVRDGQSDLVRIVRGLRGEVKMRMEFILRFDYGQSVPWVTRIDDRSLRAIAGPNMAVLRTSVPTRGENLTTVSEFTVKEDEAVSFMLSYGPSHLPFPQPIDVQTALERTEAFWKEWSGRCKFRGRWAEVVERSLITLKGLT